MRNSQKRTHTVGQTVNFWMSTLAKQNLQNIRLTCNVDLIEFFLLV